jgi:hypothetical protein
VYYVYYNIEKVTWGRGGHVAGEILNNAVKYFKVRDYLRNLVADGILK